ncbi:MAG: hypothetical protein WCS77_03710 [Elusimicrobiaceae bacterium]
MKKFLFPLMFIALAAGCSGAKKDTITEYYAPSIERAMDRMKHTSGGPELLAYLAEHPIQIRYADLPGPWPKYDTVIKQIQIPETAKDSDMTVAFLLARVLDIYRNYNTLQAQEMSVEMEEAAALRATELGIQMEFGGKDWRNSLPGQLVIEELCSYMAEGTGRMLEKVRRNSMTRFPQYGRPYNSLDKSRRWLEKAKAATAEGNLHLLLYQRDLDQMRRGFMSPEQVNKNDVSVRSMDEDSLYRYFNQFFYESMQVLDRQKKMYDQRLEQDAAWRAQNGELISSQLEHTPYCGTFVPSETDRPAEQEEYRIENKPEPGK